MAESITNRTQAKIIFSESLLSSPIAATNEREGVCDSAVSTNASSVNHRPGYSGIEERSSPLHSFLEYAMTILFPVAFIAVIYFSFARLVELDLWWTLIVALPFAWVVGDLVSGISHWIADTYGSESLPVVGKSILRPFRLHHLYPRDICTHNLVVTIGNTCILALPLLLLFLYLLWSENVSGWRAFGVLTLSLIVGTTVLTNIFHKWAHAEETSKFARALQSLHLILPPEHHERHHTTPFNSNYCITNGWLNPVLERIRFFRGLERALGKLGIKPHDAH